MPADLPPNIDGSVPRSTSDEEPHLDLRRFKRSHRLDGLSSELLTDMGRHRQILVEHAPQQTRLQPRPSRNRHLEGLRKVSHGGEAGSLEEMRPPRGASFASFEANDRRRRVADSLGPGLRTLYFSNTGW